MAKNIAFVALIFFAVVGMVAATASAATPAAADDSTGGNVIGSVSAGAATDAAPVGAPVPDGVFPTIAPAPGSESGAAALQVTAVAGAVAVAGVVGSFFF